MNILALDLGTKTGWALHVRGGQVSSGTLNCSAKASETAGQRWLNFRHHLAEMKRAAGEIHAVYYELVMAHGTKDQPNTLAAHVYGGFEAHLQLWCTLNNVRLECASVATIKKHWTGNGRAKKADMMAQARERGFRPCDDNEADALAILGYALDTEGLVRQPVREAA